MKWMERRSVALQWCLEFWTTSQIQLSTITHQMPFRVTQTLGFSPRITPRYRFSPRLGINLKLRLSLRIRFKHWLRVMCRCSLKLRHTFRYKESVWRYCAIQVWLPSKITNMFLQQVISYIRLKEHMKSLHSFEERRKDRSLTPDITHCS